MTGRVVFLFSGLGGQHFGMARGLYEALPDFRARADRLDRAAVRLLGHSPLGVAFDPARGRFEPFDRLRDANPALFTLQVALAETLIARGARPDALMGGSLGELVALAVAGTLPADELLGLVIGLARVVEDRGEAGGMLAVLGAPSLVDDRRPWFAGTELATVGSDRHFVVAGPPEALAATAAALAAADVSSLMLPVRFAFHSSRMEPLRPALSTLFAGRAWTAPRVPVLSATRVETIGAPDDGHGWRVLREPVDLRGAFRRLEERDGNLFIDLGPQGAMATAAKYNLRPGSGSDVLAAMPLYGGETAAFAAIAARLGV